ncbi:MAG TPA: BTAD domain-containing putative transcriptional regulator, partial [Candidatus Baltobacteraceae bacterium]|nr:BTAD domain-containing putative transcriptional regulator [Candidatus Baltobacteraceae bacterium]
PRPRVADWFARHAAMPLRLLVGPAGAGKTTAIASYLAGSTRPAVYLALRPETTPEQLRARLAATLDLPQTPESFDELAAALARVASCDIAIDDLDRATAETRDELGALVGIAPSGIGFIFAARSRLAIDARNLVARGLAAVAGASDLAFDADDVVRLCELLSVSHVPAEVGQLLEETEGWPIVTSWTIRDAAEGEGTLGDAYESWRRENRRTFAEFLDVELRAAGDYYRAAFRTLAADGSNGERDRLAALEARGLFVLATGDGYRPYRVARELEIEAIPAAGVVAAEPTSLLFVRMLGRFEADIGGRRIEWIRRREAQLFKYLLLKPGGAATRAELRDIFWPDAPPQLATQSIRTATSNIRKAIAAIVGYGNVERYFASRGDIAVNLQNAVIDVRRFTAHVADGDAALERGRSQEAFAHYRAAESLYSGELLSGEYPEPWYVPRAEMYKGLYVGLLERLAEYHADAGHARHAREYAARAKELAPVLRLVPRHDSGAG